MMNYQLLSPPKNRFFRLLRPVLLEYRKCQGPDVAWRLLSTAAARDIPDNVRSRKKISRVERKAMVEEYINEYRVMNAGKFPTAKNIQKQIGGGYYKVRAILQACEYNSKLSALATAGKSLTIGQTSQVIETSDAEVAPDCQLSDGEIAVVKEFGISAEFDLSHKVLVDKSSCQEMVEMTALNKDSVITSEHDSWFDREINVELGGECEKLSIDKDMSIESNIMDTQEVPVIANLVENTLANGTLMALATDDSEVPFKQEHHFEVTGTFNKPKPEELNSADEAFGLGDFTRCGVMPVGNVSTVIDNLKLDNSVILQETHNSMVGAVVNSTSEVERTLDRRVRKAKTATVDDYQVSDENDSCSQKEVDNYICQKMIDASLSIENKEVTAQDVCKTEKVVDLERTIELNKTFSACVEAGEHNGSLGSINMPQKASSLKETSAAESLKATETEDNEFTVKSSHPSESPDTLQKSDIGSIDASAAQASKFDEISRVTMAQKTQDTELHESSLWGNLKFLASSMISFWRKT